MKRFKIIVFVLMLATAARGQTTESLIPALYGNGANITNELMNPVFPYYRIVNTVTTNTYAPRQWLDTSYGCSVYGCTSDHSVWRDCTPWVSYSKTRDNPDVSIMEIRQTTTLRFEYDGKSFEVIAKDELLSKTKKVRKVSEQWEDEP